MKMKNQTHQVQNQEYRAPSDSSRAQPLIGCGCFFSPVWRSTGRSASHGDPSVYLVSGYVNGPQTGWGTGPLMIAWKKLMRTSVARQNVLGKLRWALMLLWPVNFAVLTKLDTAVGSLSWATYFSRHHCSTVARLRRKGGSVKGRGDSTNRSFKN